MCIAIYSPVGIETPSEKYLKASFENNPDGAGFAFNTDEGRVKILKGFMTWEAFIETYKRYHDEYNFKDRGVLIHFRITTHGGTCPECTHPFPLSSDAGTLQKLSSTTDYAVVHNGIISLTGTEAKTLQHMSDTMVFISKYMSKIAQYKKWFDNPITWELIYDLALSKIAVLRGDGSIHSTYGFTKDEGDGNYYSNNTYKENRVKYTYPYYSSGASYPYSSYSKYAYEDDYDDDWDDRYSSYPKSYAKTSAVIPALAGKAKSVALMKIKKGLVLNCAGFAYPMDEEDDCDYFIDATGVAYMMNRGDASLNQNSKYIKYGLMVFSEGCSLTTADGTPVTFVADHWAKTANIM